MIWDLGGRRLDFSRARIMGVLNATPDSFYDGGRYADPAAAAEHAPDVIVLDLNLPGIDGLEACRRLRSHGFEGKILMLTARHEVGDRVQGLDAGADVKVGQSTVCCCSTSLPG